jgi:hypothetical protein
MKGLSNPYLGKVNNKLFKFIEASESNYFQSDK